MSRAVQLGKFQNFVNRTAVSETKNKRVLEIKKAKTNKGRKVLNSDEGNLVQTNMWERNKHKGLTSNLKAVLITSLILITFENDFD